MTKNKIWASLVFFLSDFEHGVNKWFFRNFEKIKMFEHIIFFWSKTIKTHQINGFQSMGPSKNASAYRFHAFKWSYHHIPWIFDAVLMFPYCLILLRRKTITTHRNNGFQSLGPSNNASAYRFHAYKWSRHHISLIFDAVLMFSLEKHDQ